MSNKLELTPAVFGLDDQEVLKLARTLAPELFATLFACKTLNPPFEDHEALAAALFADADEFTGPGVRISPELFYKFLPREFFPIVDRADLIRKAYMGISASHSDGMADALKGYVDKIVPAAAQGTMAYTGACGVVAEQVGHKVQCRAGQWTRVLYASLVSGKYIGSFPTKNVKLEWRRYSSLAPAFSSGTHNTNSEYGGIVAYEPYVDYWFNPETDLTVFWSGRAV